MEMEKFSSSDAPTPIRVSADARTGAETRDVGEGVGEREDYKNVPTENIDNEQGRSSTLSVSEEDFSDEKSTTAVSVQQPILKPCDGNNESSFVEKGLILESFKNALTANPNATRFVIEKEGPAFLIQPQDEDLHDSEKNRSENESVIQILKMALRSKYSADVVTDVIIGVVSSSFNTQVDYNVPLSAARLRQIVERLESVDPSSLEERDNEIKFALEAINYWHERVVSDKIHFMSMKATGLTEFSEVLLQKVDSSAAFKEKPCENAEFGSHKIEKAISAAKPPSEEHSQVPDFSGMHLNKTPGEVASHYETTLEKAPVAENNFLQKKFDIAQFSLSKKVEERVIKQEESPDSVAIGTMKMDESELADGTARRVTFPDFSSLIEEEKSKATKTSSNFGKIFSADVESDKYLDKSIRRVKSLITDLEIKIDDITEEDLEKTSKIAAVYQQAYPQFEAHLNFLLSAIDQGMILKKESSCLHLGRSAVRLLEVAFQSIDRSKMRPVERESCATELPPHDPLIIQHIPFLLVPMESKVMELCHGKVVEAVCAADNMIHNLQEIMNVIRAPDEDVGKLFLESQVLKVGRAFNVLARRTSHLSSISLQLRKEGQEDLENITPAWMESNKELQEYLPLCDQMEEAQKANQITVSEAREKGFLELYQLARESITTSQKLMDATNAKL